MESAYYVFSLQRCIFRLIIESVHIYNPTEQLRTMTPTLLSQLRDPEFQQVLSNPAALQAIMQIQQVFLTPFPQNMNYYIIIFNN